jgi:hypothetical protein
MSSGPEPNQVTVYYRCFSCLSWLLIWVNKTVFNSGPDDSSSTCHNFRATTTIVCVQSSEMKRKRPGPWFSRFRVRGVLIHQFINGRFAVGGGVVGDEWHWDDCNSSKTQVITRGSKTTKNVLVFSRPGYIMRRKDFIWVVQIRQRKDYRASFWTRRLYYIPIYPRQRKGLCYYSLYWPKCLNGRFPRPGLLVSRNLGALAILGDGLKKSYCWALITRAGSTERLVTHSATCTAVRFPAAW